MRPGIAGWWRRFADALQLAAASACECECAQAVREERRRLHRDLHDDLGPTLAGLRLRLFTVAERVADHPAARQLVLEAAAEAGRLMGEIRRVIDDAHPWDLEQGKLGGALVRLAAGLSGTGVAVTADVPSDQLDLPWTTERAAYRIAKEGLTNALKHAAAQHVRLRLVVDEQHLVLELDDDGIGPPSLPGARRGMGLDSMEQRAAEASGYCVVLPAPESGTLVRAVLPRRAA
ncbi:sensor histidine kinase [Nonomuraea typhae]|uniref:sensor histidine kinase n=1 Tax=Nonomuraea typhae TaxID=2603600 RepID=UPI0012FA1D27|nr:histidine kinase [Nonomuraea typhae]